MTRQRQVNEHDVILVGAGLGSLVAGTLLSRKGYSVLLLRERGYDPVLTKEGYRFVPVSNFSERVIRSPVLRRLFQSLAVLPAGGGGSGGQPPSSGQRSTFQVILPEARIDLFPDRNGRQEEWRREFPRELLRIEQFYSEMANQHERLKRQQQGNSSSIFPLRPPSLLRRVFQSEPWLDLSSFTTEFKHFIRLQLTAWGSMIPDRYPASLAAYHLAPDASPDWITNVDLPELEGNLLAEYLRSGGTVEEIEGVETISRSWMKGVALLLSRQDKIIRSRYLVLNAPVHRLASLPGHTGVPSSMWEKRMRPRFVLFPLFLGVQEKVVPVGMKDLVISLRFPDKSYDRGNLLFLAFSPEGEEAHAPKGKRGLAVGSFVSWEEYSRGWDQACLNEHREGVLRHLHHLIPYLDDYVEFIDFDWGDQLIRHWSYPLFHYEARSAFSWREGVIPWRLSKNIYVAGIQNFPYLGLEGEALGGWMAAHQIMRKSS